MPNKFKIKTDTALSLKPSVGGKHTAFFSSKSWGILATIIAIVGLLLALLSPSLCYLTRTAIILTILVMLSVLIFNNKARYSTIMFLRQLDQRLAATKTYGDDKKPANHDD